MLLALFYLVCPIYPIDAYSESLATSLAWYSAAAYCNEKSLPAWSCRPCWHNKAFDFKDKFERGGLFGYYGYDKNLEGYVLVFRGSDNGNNYLSDSLLLMIPYPVPGDSDVKDAVVHAGFYAASKELEVVMEKQFNSYVESGSNQSAPIYVTGHSLGGALAVLLAMNLNQQKRARTFLYTFGQPRVGNNIFSQQVEKKIKVSYRITHAEDPIVHMPGRETSWPWEIPYAHFRDEVFYPKRLSIDTDRKQDPGKFTICRSAESKDCAAGVNAGPMDDHRVYMGIAISKACGVSSYLQDPCGPDNKCSNGYKCLRHKEDSKNGCPNYACCSPQRDLNEGDRRCWMGFPGNGYASTLACKEGLDCLKLTGDAASPFCENRYCCANATQAGFMEEKSVSRRKSADHGKLQYALHPK